MAKKDIAISRAHAVILIEALEAKIASQLMKKSLQDAAAPVYAEVKRINQDISDLKDACADRGN